METAIARLRETCGSKDLVRTVVKRGYALALAPAVVSAALVLCAHGTRDPLGARDRARGGAAVAERLPGVEVLEAYVDVHGPDVAEVVAGLPAGGGEVPGWWCRCCSPAGYHVHVDIAQAVAGRPDVRSTGALGPDDLLVDVLVERLEAAGAGAGSGRAGARPGRATPGPRRTAPTWRSGSPSGGAERCTWGIAAGPHPRWRTAVAAGSCGRRR